jgi:WD40 repeat protein
MQDDNAMDDECMDVDENDFEEVDDHLDELRGADNEDDPFDVNNTVLASDVVDADNVVEDEEDKVVDMADVSFTLHSDAVYCIACHPFIQNLIATGGVDDKVFLWFVPTANMNGERDPDYRAVELVGHTDTITSVGFNFNGQQLLSGSYDGSVIIWSVATKEMLLKLEGPEDIEWACWHGRGNAVLAGSKDGTVWMWLSHNGQCMQVFTGHNGLVNCGTFSLDGKHVITSGEDGTLRVWMPKTGVCRKTFEASRQGGFTCLALSENNILAGCEDGNAYLFSLVSMKLVQTFVHDQTNGEEHLNVECVGFSVLALGWCATGGLDNYLRVWEANGSCRCSIAHNGGVVALQWHPDLPFLCTGSLDCAVRLVDARSGEVFRLFTGHLDGVTTVSLVKLQNNSTGPAENISSIVSLSDDGSAKVFFVNFNEYLIHS